MKNCLLEITLVIALGLAIQAPESANAQLSLASPLADNAVLQQAMPVPIWGNAVPGATVTVEFAGQKKSGKADADGRWQVELDPLEASFTPESMTVTSAENQEKLSIKNVLVGEVWICSGQSNMQMGYQNVPEIKALIPSAKNLRKFTVRQTVAFAEQDRCEGQWKERHPDSAVAFAFAYFLEEASDVPVGIVQTC